MEKKIEPPGPIVIRVPLSTFLFLVLFLSSHLFGPVELLRSWFAAKASILDAEARKQAIEIVGAENYFKGCK